MKTASSELAAHVAAEVTTTCTLWKLIRRDNVVKGFTDHDRDLTVSGVLYQAATGYTRTAISGDATLSVDNMDLEGIIASGSLTADDIRAGLYDWAELVCMLCNYADLTQGTVILRRGFLGEFTLKAGVFVTELRGISQALSRNFVEVTTPDCQADLGDVRCKVDLTAHRETGSITAITTQRRIATVTITGARAAGYFNGGLITWATGNNTGAKQELKTLTGGTLTLYLPAAEDLTVGDTFTVQASCDKTTTMCKGRYNNIANMRAFPFIPGTDLVQRTPNAKPAQ